MVERTVLDSMERFIAIVITLYLGLSTIGYASEKLTLNEFLSRVRAQNLDLKIAAAQVNASEAYANGIRLPPPMVAGGKMLEDSGKSANVFEVSQKIPFPTKIANDHSARRREAGAQKEIYQARQQEIMTQARLLYLELWAAQRKRDLLQEQKSILENHIKLARSSARSDSFASVHVLETESERDLMENDILRAEQLFQEKQLQMAAFLNLNPSEFSIEPAEPELPTLPSTSPTTSTHQIHATESAVESLKSKESLAKSEWLPDFSLQYKRRGATGMAPAGSEVMVGVTLPFVFFWQPQAAAEKAGADRIRGEYQLEKQKKEILADQASLLMRLQSLKTQLETYSQKLIPRAERRVKLVRNLAPRDMETLRDHRETMEAFPELKLRALALRLEYERAFAQLAQYQLLKGTQYE